MTDSPAAPDRSLQAQPASEDIANALSMARFWGTLVGENPPRMNQGEIYTAFQGIARLLGNAVAKLDGASGPPNTQEPQ